MTFPATGRKVEEIIVSEEGETGREKIHVVSLLGGIQKMETDELLCQREMASQTYGSQEEVMIPKEEKRRAGRNELVQINIHTPALYKNHP